MVESQLDSAGQAGLARNINLVKRLARIESLEKAREVPPDAIAIIVDGGVFPPSFIRSG